MRVVLVRHAKAFPDAPTGQDKDRTLRPRGLRQADHLGLELTLVDPRPRLVWASPYPRAWETAVRLAARLGVDPIEEPRLEVGCTASGLLDLIVEAHGDPLCLVGHNPTMEDAAGVLLHGPSGPPIRFRTGEAMCFDVDPRCIAGSGKLAAQFRLED